MNNIFISYRREDAADVTGRINDRLRQYYGEEAIFTDVDNIPFGVDFRAYLDQEVSQCKVLLAVIGRNWLIVKNDQGQPRLSDPTDFVRIEIESALQRNIPVIPLLVHGTKMPSGGELPESLRGLTFRNGTLIRPDPDFHNDMDRLIKGLDQHLRAYQQEEKHQKTNVEEVRKTTEEEKHRQHKTKVERKSREEKQRKPEKQKRLKTENKQRRKATAESEPWHTAVSRQMKAEFWKCLLTNIGGVGIGLTTGYMLTFIFMDQLIASFGGDEMVATLMFFTAGGASVGAMQNFRLRNHFSDVTRWILVSLLGWTASGVFIGFLLAFNVLEDWVALMILLPFVGGAVTGMLQTRILKAVSSRAYFWWLASTLAWPVGAAIGAIFGDRREATILFVPFGGVVCWLVVTAATMAWLLTSGQNDATEQRTPTKQKQQ